MIAALNWLADHPGVIVTLAFALATAVVVSSRRDD